MTIISCKTLKCLVLYGGLPKQMTADPVGWSKCAIHTDNNDMVTKSYKMPNNNKQDHPNWIAKKAHIILGIHGEYMIKGQCKIKVFW